MRSFSLFLIATLLVFASSCVITQDIYVAKDESGSVKFKIDMSEMMAAAGGMGDGEEESASMFEDSTFAQSIEQLRNTPGITDVVLEEDTKKGIYVFGFSTDNIKLLNEGVGASDLRATGGEQNTDFNYLEVTKKGKKVHFELPPPPKSDEVEEAGTEDDGMADEMMEMMRYKLNLRFERKIKKVKTDLDYTIDEATNTVKLDVPLDRITDEDNKFELDIILK